MRSAALTVLSVCSFLGACETARPARPAPVVCPTSAAAPVEPEPVAPDLTSDQRRAVDVAVITVLGPQLGAALIRYTDVEHPAWGRRAAARATATADWCASVGAG